MKHRALFLGDSQTAVGNGYTRPARMWPYQLERFLNGLGANVRCSTFGVSGDTIAQALDRAHGLHRFAKAPWGDPAALAPELAGVYVGVNDVAASVPQATMQTNAQAIIKSLKHGAFGAYVPADAGRGIEPLGPCYVATPAALPADGRLGMRIVCLADTEPTTGAAPNADLVAAGLQASNVTTPSTSGGNSGQSVWEYRNPLPGIYGWGRVVKVDTAAPTWCERILVVSTNYLNFTAGGDTPSTPHAGNATARAALLAAVARENVAVSGVPSVIYTDLYGFQRALIVAGTDPNFSADTAIVPTVAFDPNRSWHVRQPSFSTLSSGLSTGGGAITSLPVTATTAALANGQSVMVGSGTHWQNWVLTASASIGATSLTVASQVPNFNYPSGSMVGSDNQHHNEYGNFLVAQAVLDGGPAGTALPDEWVEALA